MLPPQLLRQVRRLQYRARRIVSGAVGGEYRSVFKGIGITFEEVREYQPGEDIRLIDWNVTARMGHPYVKCYTEERELTLILVMDWSGSQEFSSSAMSKRQVLAELAAVLAFCGVANHDRVGLIGFTDRVEQFIPPKKGAHHALRLVREMLFYPAAGRGTDLVAPLEFLNRVFRRRAVVVILSDFLDHGYEWLIKQIARRHELIAVRVTDPRELKLPAIGLVVLEDAETGEQTVVNTRNLRTRQAYEAASQLRANALTRLARSGHFDLMEVSTKGAHLEELWRFLRARQKNRSKQ